MGVLEDAIREHLELKRQHGASEQELDQQESEALGAARREASPETDAEAEPAAVEAASEEPVAESAPEEPIAEEEAVAEEPVAEPDIAEEPPEPVADHPGDPDPDPDPEPDPEPEPEPEEAPALEEEPPGVLAGDAPTGFADAAGPEEEDFFFDEEEPGVAPPMPGPHEEPSSAVEGDEDVLEETPDFLQETPEHDRLWFEQKPPRDFDFD